jgi:hypothetical protein
MTLGDFFLAVNAAAIRLANVGGQLQLRGHASAISPEIKAAAAEHRAALLALLPATLPEGVGVASPGAGPGGPAGAEAEGLTGGREGPAGTCQGEMTPAEAAWPPPDSDGRALVGGFRHDHDWRDWRLEWLLELGTLHLRLRCCQDPDVRARLRPLAEATPTSVAEWLALGQQIANTEHELRQQGRLPPYPWPERR